MGSIIVSHVKGASNISVNKLEVTISKLKGGSVSEECAYFTEDLYDMSDLFLALAIWLKLEVFISSDYL